MADALALTGAAVLPKPGRRVTSKRVGWFSMVLGVVLTGAGGIVVASTPWAGFALIGLGLWQIVSGANRLLPQTDVVMWVAAGWLALILLSAILAPLLPLGEHEAVSKTLLIPGYLSPDLWSSHPLGTNVFGLDQLARVIYGARISLVTGICAATIGFVVGGLIGLAAGFLGGFTDRSVSVFTDAILAFPGVILLIALASALPRGVGSSIIGLSILAIPTNVRLARANTMALKQRDHVTAARVLGARRSRIMFKEILPSVVIAMLAYIFIVVAVLIVAEASLSFLGLGVQQPTPTWGNMIAEGDAGVFEDHPSIVLVPGIAIFLTVLCLNLLGERFRAALEAGGFRTEKL